MKYFKYLLIFFIIFSSTAGFGQSFKSYRKPNEKGIHKYEPNFRSYFTQRQHNFDVTYYDLHVTPSYSNHSVSGICNMTATSTTFGLTGIELDLVDLDVFSTTLNGENVQFAQSDTTVWIQFPSVINTGEEFTVSVEYGGNPTAGMAFVADGPEIHTHNQPFYARHWFPCWDHPGDKADSASMHITLPDSTWICASNGIETDITHNDDGTITSHWHTSYPIVTYLFVFSATPIYQILQQEYMAENGTTMPMPHYIHGCHYQEAQTSLENMPDIMETEVSLFGEYPFLDEKYTMLTAHITYFSGMENQTSTFINPNYIDGTHRYESLYVHELAHHWWGDCVTIGDWADIWLNEGFATYTEALYTEKLGEDIRDYLLESIRDVYFDSGITQHEVYLYDVQEEYIFDVITYEKAAMVLHMLRGIVGTDTFFDILDQYFEEYQYGTVLTTNFIEVCEQVSQQNLEWFFDQWIYGLGYPIFDVKWDYAQTPDGEYILEAVFIQNQQEDWPTFIMTSRAGADYGDENYELHPIQIDGDTTLVSLDIQNTPIDFAFDPEEWFVCKKKNVSNIDKFSISQITIDDDNENELLEPEEDAQITLEVKNNLLVTQGIVGFLSTTDEEVEVTQSISTFGDISGLGGTSNNSMQPFEIQIGANGQPHYATFTLVMEDSNGYQFTTNFELLIGQGDILLIDDDSGEGYEEYYIEPLMELGLLTHFHSNKIYGSPSQNLLNEYQNVIWFTGDEGQNTLTIQDQEALADYLDNGGNLFLSGQNIGDDIGNTSFFTDYLHAQHMQDTWEGTKMLQGTVGDPIGNGAMLIITGEGGAENQHSPSVCEPTGDAHKVFDFMPPGQSDGGAIRYDGEYKMVYFSFGFEAINKTNDNVMGRGELMARILTYFDMDVAVEDNPSTIAIPEKFNLNQNYPNPFNPSTTIQFEIPHSGGNTRGVQLNIYDISGKLIKTLLDEPMEAGYHSVVWNGKNEKGNLVESGIYLYQLTNDHRTITRSMILIK